MSEAHDGGDDELHALLEAARALLAWEDELGSIGVPEAVLVARASTDEPRAREERRTEPREERRAEPREARRAEPREARRDESREEPRDEPPRAASLRQRTEPRALPERAAPESRVDPARDLERTSARASAAPLAPDELVRRLDVLASEAATCTACRLHEGRTKSVFSRGAPTAQVAFVGEGPGFHEDQSGLPFVGAAGQLLDKMIAAMGLAPSEIYVCNVVKCRPPENRTPTPDEASACSRFLRAQLELVAPEVIVALGRSASEGLGCIEPGARGWRGAWTVWNGIPVMSTFHPAYLLRSPEQKRPVWEDLQAVVAKLGRSLPRR